MTKNKYISFANRPERRITYHAGRYFPVQGRVFYDMALFVGSTLPTIWAECIIDWRHLFYDVGFRFANWGVR